MSIQNPLGNYNFLLQIDGVDMLRVQVVTPPTVEYTEHLSGSAGNGPDFKSPGKKIVGDLVIECLVPDNGDPEVWERLNSAAGGIRSQYAGIGVLSEIGPSGTPGQNFFLDQIWLKKIEKSTYETTAGSSDNAKRTLTFSVGDYRPV